jgi:hypothetical protein
MITVPRFEVVGIVGTPRDRPHLGGGDRPGGGENALEHQQKSPGDANGA